MHDFDLFAKKSSELLSVIYKKFHAKYNYDLFVALELEFYLFGKDFDYSKFYEFLLNKSLDYKLNIHSFAAEIAENQYEVSLQPDHNPSKLATDFLKLKELLNEAASEYNLELCFGKENMHDCGVHIHINFFHDKKNIFIAKNNFHIYKNTDSEILLNSVGGLLYYMEEMLPILVPKDADYKRFNSSSFYCPSTISWGGNNRTTAIRIPEHTVNPQQKRIEHRVISCNADIFLVLSAIIAAIDLGISEKLLPPEKIYGNSFDKQYNLNKLPVSLEEARNRIKTEHIYNYLNECLKQKVNT